MTNSLARLVISIGLLGVCAFAGDAGTQNGRRSVSKYSMFLIASIRAMCRTTSTATALVSSTTA